MSTLTEPLTPTDLVRGWYERGALTYNDLLLFHRALGREHAAADHDRIVKTRDRLIDQGVDPFVLDLPELAL